MKKIKFDDFVRLNRGFDLPDSQVVDGPYPVVASTSIKTYHNQYKVEPPVVVTGRSGSLGKVQYINERCWPLNTSLYSKDFRDNYPLYVYYYLQLMHLEQYNAGAGVPTLNQNHLHGLKILIHERAEQEKVANALFVFDKAIENNNKRIKILEKVAENLYKEWFVRFRFPGHENAEFENGIPKTWEIKRLKEVLSLLDSQRKPLSSMERDGMAQNYPYYGAAGQLGYVEDYIFDGTYLLLGEDGSVITDEGYPYLQYVWGKFWVNNHAHIIEKNGKYSVEFLYCLFKKMNIQAIVTGVAQPKISQGRLLSKKIIIPDDNTLKRFDELIQPLFLQMKKLTESNLNLIKQRDLLLPRLMSGKLQVK